MPPKTTVVCNDYSSLYSLYMNPINVSSILSGYISKNFAAHLADYCHHFKQEDSDDNHTHYTPLESSESFINANMMIMYNDKELEKGLKRLSKETIDNKLSIVTIVDSYQNILDFLENKSIVFLSQTDIIPETLDYFVKRVRVRRGTGFVAKNTKETGDYKETSLTSPTSPLLNNPFYIFNNKAIGEISHGTLDQEYNDFMTKHTYKRLQEISKKAGEYKIFPERFQTTVMFLSNKAVKVFTDGDRLRESDKNRLSCQEVLDMIK